MSDKRIQFHHDKTSSFVEDLNTIKLEKGQDQSKIYTSIDEIETVITHLKNIGDVENKLLIRLLLRKCQLLGIDENWHKVSVVADTVLSKLNYFEKEVDFAYRSNIEARVLGYKGFSLMKLNNIDEAIILLSKSYELRMCDVKHVALVNEKRNKDPKKSNASLRKEYIEVEKALTFCCQKKGIATPVPPLIKFSRTEHLFDSGGTAVTNDDLVLSKDDSFYNQFMTEKTTLYVEEKVDGANFGLSLSADGEIFAQNRSHYISTGEHAQFGPLATWIEENRLALTNILRQNEGSTNIPASQGLILYGEWVVARHSIPYHRLPSYFIAFDIYDRRRQRFWSRKRFHSALKGSGIPVVPMIRAYTPQAKTAKLFREELLALLGTQSQFRTDGGPVEGIVLRVDNYCDNDSDEYSWLSHRSKIVRPDFVRGCNEHWSRRAMEKQTVDFDFAQKYIQNCYKCAED